MSIATENSGFDNKEIDFAFIIQQYQVLSDRRINHNTLLWDVPSLLFVAQTFLWTIALSSEINPIIRCAISLISVIIAITSFQAFERNRLMEVVDAEQMYKIERYFKEYCQGNADFPAIIVHHQLKRRTFIFREDESANEDAKENEDKNKSKNTNENESENTNKEKVNNGNTDEKVDKFLETHPYYKKHKGKLSLCRQSSVFLWKTVFISSLFFSIGLLVYNIYMIWVNIF